MRHLTRSELKRAARAAGLPEDHPSLYDGSAEKLVEAGIHIGARVALNVIDREKQEQEKPVTPVDDIPIYSHKELKRISTGLMGVGYVVGVVFGAGIVYILVVMGKLAN